MFSGNMPLVRMKPLAERKLKKYRKKNKIEVLAGHSDLRCCKVYVTLTDCGAVRAIHVWLLCTPGMGVFRRGASPMYVNPFIVRMTET